MPQSAAVPRLRRGVPSWPLITIFVLLGFHVDLRWTVNNGSIPNILGLPFGLLLLVLHAQRIQVRHLGALLMLISLFLVNAFYAVLLREAGLDPFLAIGLLLVSILSGYGLYLDLTAWPKGRLHVWFGRLFLALLSIAFVEVLTPLKDIVMGFWELFGDTRAAAEAARNAALFGGYRPTAFASEPSHLGVALALCQIVWITTAPRLDVMRVGVLLFGSLAGLAVVRSPMAILPIIYLAGILAFQLRRQKKQSVYGFVRIVAAGAGGLFLLSALAILLSRAFSERMYAIFSGSDWSTTVRTYGAFIASYRVALENPLFGVGVNNFEYARSIIFQTYLQYRVPIEIANSDILENLIGTNGFAPALIYFGFGGAFIYFATWGLIISRLAPAASASVRWILLVITCLTAGSIYSPVFVWPMMVVIAAAQVCARQAPQPASPQWGETRRGPTTGRPPMAPWDLARRAASAASPGAEWDKGGI